MHFFLSLLLILQAQRLDHFPTLDDKIQAGMGIEDVVEHFIDSEYDINVPILETLLQNAIKRVDSAVSVETLTEKWEQSLKDDSDLAADAVTEGAAESENEVAQGNLNKTSTAQGLGEVVMWMAM
jgi:hypothetical protein